MSSLVNYTGSKFGQEWSEWGNSKLDNYVIGVWITREFRHCVGKNGAHLGRSFCGDAKTEQFMANSVVGIKLSYLNARNYCEAQGKNCYYNLNITFGGWRKQLKTLHSFKNYSKIKSSLKAVLGVQTPKIHRIWCC